MCRLLAVSLFALMSYGAVAQAAEFGAGPAYGGTSSVGGTVTCRIFNFGAFTATVTVRQIWDNNGANVPLAGDTCGAGLGSGKTCAFSAPIGGNLAYSCRAYALGNDTNLSGDVEIQNSSHAILNSLALVRGD